MQCTLISKLRKNKYKYLRYRLFSLIAGLPWSFLSCFIPRDKTLVILNSSQNEHFSHNSKYLMLEYLASPQAYDHTFLFVIRNKSLRDQLNRQYGPYFIGSSGLKNKWTILKAGVWMTSTLETPIGGFGYRFRREVLHLGHGMPFKRIVYQEKRLSFVKRVYYMHLRANFSRYLATTEFYKPIIQSTFRVPEKAVYILPQPKADAVNCRIRPFQDIVADVQLKTQSAFDFDQFNVLFAPTWRHYSDTKLLSIVDDMYAFNSFLQDHDIVFWMRPHPMFEDDLTNSGHTNIRSFSSKDFEDVSEYLSIFNGLITDYSSIGLDFLSLGRPVLHVHDDLDQYQRHVGLIDQYNDVMVTDAATDTNEFRSKLVQMTIKTKSFNSEISKANLNANHSFCEERAISSILKSLKS